MRRSVIVVLACMATTLWAVSAVGGEAEVVDARARLVGDAWAFEVTVRHADEGWDHYADAWRVVGPDGAVYGTRTLWHPHVDEQPFTRSLPGVVIPEGVTRVTIEAHDGALGWGGRSLTLELSR